TLLLALALTPTPSLTAAPAGAVTLDGVLDEATWAEAEMATGFIQFEPNEGVPASERTEVRVLRGENALLVGARMWSEGEIRTPLSRRDDDGDADVFLVAIDSYNDGRTAYAFGVTAAGVQFDALLEGDDDDESWDAVWESSVRVGPDGWTAELRIPYSQLRFAEGQDTWGINFQRVMPARGEEVYWAPVTRAELQAGIVQLFGRLNGLSGIKPSPVLQATPYTLAGGSRRESDVVPGTGSAGFDGDVGVDVKVGLASNAVLDLTVNPDFGQVEADPAELNLGPFELIFDERRPFFVEGTQIFDLTVGGGRDGALLYTRRIGADAPIIAATKLSGRTPAGLSYGGLAAATGDNFDPNRFYAASRVRQELSGQSYVGAGLTAFSRLSTDTSPSVTSIAGAADWDLRFADESWQFEGTAAGTARSAGDDSQVGGALYVGLDKVSGYLTPGFGLRVFTEDFQLNDVGRFRRTDIFRLVGGSSYLWNRGQPVGPFRRVRTAGFGGQSWALSTGQSLGLGIFSFNQLELGFQEIDLSAEVGGIGGVDIFESRGLGPVENVPGVSARVGYDSDSRRQLQWGLRLRGGADAQGARTLGVGAQLEWIVNDGLSVQVEGGLSQADNERAWAANESFFRTASGFQIGATDGAPDAFDDSTLLPFETDGAVFDGLATYSAPLAVDGEAYYLPVFGARDTREVNIATRAQVIFGPTLSLQMFGQVFAARGQFRDFSLLTAPDDLRPFGEYPKRRDFSLASFNANAVLRWEYRPGSALFVVWSQGRDDALFEDRFRAGAPSSPFETDSGRQLLDTFDAFPTDVVLVKLSYLIMR
ncbi:MAG: DUF5916 domain-containing protein, partial [Bacteroidota bacterium]